MGLIDRMRPGDVRRAGSGRERGKVGREGPSRALLFFSPDPAHPAPVFLMDPTDREPGTGYLSLYTLLWQCLSFKSDIFFSYLGFSLDSRPGYWWTVVWIACGLSVIAVAVLILRCIEEVIA